MVVSERASTDGDGAKATCIDGPESASRSGIDVEVACGIWSDNAVGRDCVSDPDNSLLVASAGGSQPDDLANASRSADARPTETDLKSRTAAYHPLSSVIDRARPLRHGHHA